MKNISWVLLVGCYFGCVQAHQVTHAARLASALVRANKRTVDWLVIVYIAADNNLSSAADENLRQLKQLGSNSRVSVVAQVSWRSSSRKTRRYLIKKGRVVTLATLGKVDSGNKQTLINFVTAMIRKYPARKLFLDLWDHGSGYVNSSDFSLRRSICYDQTHNSIMSSVDVRDALAAICQATQRTFDIVGCDACMMQMLEFGTLLAPYTSLLVGSEETIPDEGFNYTAMLKPFKKHTLSATDFAKQMVRDYASLYRHYFWGVTLSAVNISNMLVLERNVDTVGDLLCQCLAQQPGATRTTIAQCLQANTCVHFELAAYIDLGTWYQTLLAHVADFGVTPDLQDALTQALNTGLTLLGNAVLLKTATRNDSAARGISLCFPVGQVYPSYANSPFALSNRWVTFLNLYFGS